MTRHTGLYVARDASNNGTTPQGARLAQAGLIEWAGPNPLDTRQGVFYDTGAPVVAGTAGMSYDVRAFVATGRLSAAAGPWVAANDATYNVATGAAPGSNSRIDVIWCRQHLVASDGGADTDVILEIGVTQGTVAASPTIPTIPTGALALMRTTVPSGTTATNTLTFTQMHEWVGARSGGGVWADYTPTWTNMGTLKASSKNRYTQVNKQVTVCFEPIFNAGGASAVASMTLPVAAALPANSRKVVGTAMYRVAATGACTLYMVEIGGDGKAYFKADGASANANGVSANDDQWIGTITYEAA